MRQYAHYVNVITASGYASGMHRGYASGRSRGTDRVVTLSVKPGEGGNKNNNNNNNSFISLV